MRVLSFIALKTRRHTLNITLLFCLAIPTLVSAQSTLDKDTATRRLILAECDDMIFSKVEILPSVKGGENALADSLSSYLKKQKAVIKGRASFIFMVTKNAQLIGIKKVSGRMNSEKIFKEGLLAYSNMWLPALQNLRKVCAVVRLDAEFKKGLVYLKVTQ